MRMPKSLFFSVEKRRNKRSLTGFEHVLVMRGSKASEGMDVFKWSTQPADITITRTITKIMNGIVGLCKILGKDTVPHMNNTIKKIDLTRAGSNHES